jgi:hypothetical protein
MSSYRSAYENYYKNINNTEKGKKDNNNYFSLGKKTDNSIGSKYGGDMKHNDNMTTRFIKRIISELVGATLLLLLFFALKYIPSNQVNGMHIQFKQTLENNFNYNESIDALNTIQIGNAKGQELNIGNFTTEDLKIENLKLRASNFIDYIKGNSNFSN